MQTFRLTLTIFAHFDKLEKPRNQFLIYFFVSSFVGLEFHFDDDFMVRRNKMNFSVTQNIVKVILEGWLENGIGKKLKFSTWPPQSCPESLQRQFVIVLMTILESSSFGTAFTIIFLPENFLKSYQIPSKNDFGWVLGFSEVGGWLSNHWGIAKWCTRLSQTCSKSFCRWFVKVLQKATF